MSTDELVSVIVPVYGVEDYLHRCVSSLLAQTHTLIEIILVDDGSPDGSGDLCDTFAAADSRIRVIHQQNGGLSAARNAGIALARGSYLTFVDSDDWVHEDLVNHLLSIADEAGADLAICRFLFAQDENVPRSRRIGNARTLSTREALELYAGPSTSIMTTACAKLFRAELFRDIRFAVGRFHEDEFTTYRLVAAARKVVLSEAGLYYYFSRPDSITRRPRGVSQLLDSVDDLRGQAEFFGDRRMPAVSGDCLRRAFLIQRRIRSRVAHSEEEAVRRKLKQATKEVAAALRASVEPMPVKAVASIYAVWPQPVDAAVVMLNAFRRRRRSRG